MRVFKVVLLAVPFLLLASSIVLAGQVANYELQNSLASSDGNSASLVDLGTGSFVTDTVAGQQCTVFDFAEQTGLSLDIAGLFETSAYSFVAMMRFSETSSYAKILDVRNRNLDEGLYAYQSGLIYYDYSNNNLDQLSNDVWAQVVLAYDGSTLRGYVDGVEAFAVADSSNVGGIGSSNLFFFRDDQDTSDGENSAGRVANIQLYDHALSAQEVAALAFNCADNGPGTPLADQTITNFTATPSTGMVGGSSALSATASSGLSVTYGSNTPTVCTVAGSTVSHIAVGTCTVTADQAGDASFNPAPRVLLNIQVEDEVVAPPPAPSEPIPTVSAWGKIGMIFILMLAGIGYTRKSQL